MDSARWCDVCNGYGNHHTDRHSEFIKENDMLRIIDLPVHAAYILDNVPGVNYQVRCAGCDWFVNVASTNPEFVGKVAGEHLAGMLEEPGRDLFDRLD